MIEKQSAKRNARVPSRSRDRIDVPEKGVAAEVAPGTLTLRDAGHVDKVSERIAKDVVHEIVQQELQPGAALPVERELIEKYGASRFSVREALRILEMLGLVTLKTGRIGGPKLRDVTSRDFARVSTFYYQVAGVTTSELLDARLLLEPALAAMAARRATPQERQDLLESTRLARIETSPLSTIMPIYEMHKRIAEMTHNRVIGLLGQSLRDVHEAKIGSRFGGKTLERLQTAHESIAIAVVDANVKLAEDLMREHMSDLLDLLNKHYPKEMKQSVNWDD